MTQKRLVVFFFIILVIVTGLLSRKIDFIPLWVGDALWALMVYLIVRLLLFDATSSKVALIALAFSFIIEFSQLYQADWINRIRDTVPGHLVLGKGFLWADLLAYMLGVLLGICIDKLILTRKQVFS